MRVHTDSYLIYKRQVEEILDFAVLVCYAVPSLKMQMKVADEGTYDLPRPDFFIHDQNTNDGLRKLSVNYRSRLGSFIWITCFSYFEAYIKSVVGEMIEFHGGKVEFLERSVRRNQQFFNPPDEVRASKRKLQGSRTGSKILKYRKHSKILVENDFRFPSDLFSSYGVKRLIEDFNEPKAKDLPDLLSSCLLFNFENEDRHRYHEIRDMRNKIAHGAMKTVDFGKAFGANNDLRRLAALIDKHLIEHFFVFEDYV